MISSIHFFLWRYCAKDSCSLQQPNEPAIRSMVEGPEMFSTCGREETSNNKTLNHTHLRVQLPKGTFKYFLRRFPPSDAQSRFETQAKIAPLISLQSDKTAWCSRTVSTSSVRQTSILLPNTEQKGDGSHSNHEAFPDRTYVSGFCFLLFRLIYPSKKSMSSKNEAAL